jgi:hypothetical protein
LLAGPDFTAGGHHKAGNQAGLNRKRKLNMSYRNTKKPADAKKGPIDEIRVQGCKVAVWENQTDKGVRHNVTFQRSYLDSENKWQTTDSYGLSDLLAHRAAVDLAISRLIETRNGDDD